jgi:putative peptide zinc metalloprotease protein
VKPAEEMFNFSEEKPVLALRKDLKITPITMRGRRMYFVKDPIALKYFRWGEREYHLAMLLDGKRRGHELIEAMARTFPADRSGKEEVERIVNQLLGAGLLKTDGHVARLLERKTRDHVRQAARRKRWLTLPGKVIMFKVTLFDPDLLLLRLSRHLRFLWSWQASAVLLAMLAAAAWLVTSDAANLGARMPDLLGWQNILIMWLVLLAVKVVHEFGHGLACKHFGGEVHEMGAMFIVFSPFLFCNASDSWMLPEKWKRLVVVFGGIYFELFLAAVGAALWVLTPPGLVNQIAFNVMLVCSVVTIFFNANPLMKFDGYYALSDLLEMPNLKERGDRTLISRSSELLSGVAAPPDPLARSMEKTLIFYAVASYAWMLFMAYNILVLLGGLLEPVGLDRLAQSTAGITLLAGLLAPPVMVGMTVMKSVRSDATGQASRRSLLTIALVLAVLAASFAWPVPVSVRSACVIDGENRVRVTAATQGFLEPVTIHDGTKVTQGDLLARLNNPALERELESTRLRLRIAQLEESKALQQAGGATGGVRAVRRQLEAALAKAESDVAGLELRAPVTGVVVGSHLAEKQGTLLRRGDLFCEIVPEGPLQAVVALNEGEAGLVKEGQRVSFRLHSLASQTFHGRVLEVDTAPVRELPHQSLGQQAGGTIPSVLSAPEAPEQARALPAEVIYRARIAVDNTGEALRPGMSGRIKIECGRSPLGKELWRRFITMIRADFRL